MTVWSRRASSRRAPSGSAQKGSKSGSASSTSQTRRGAAYAASLSPTAELPGFCTVCVAYPSAVLVVHCTLAVLDALDRSHCAMEANSVVLPRPWGPMMPILPWNMGSRAGWSATPLSASANGMPSDCRAGGSRRTMRGSGAENKAGAGTLPWHRAANTMASAITGVMGMPQTMKAVQVLIRMAISYGESLLELHTLFSGGEVPLIKDKTTWNLTLKTMAEQLRNKQIVKKGKKNISYKDYLKLFLLTKGNSRTVCYRMMDIMQENIASKEPGFLMENCLFSYSWKGSLAAGGVKLNFVKQCSY